jgi:hypothetical protein
MNTGRDLANLNMVWLLDLLERMPFVTFLPSAAATGLVVQSPREWLPLSYRSSAACRLPIRVQGVHKMDTLRVEILSNDLDSQTICGRGQR